MFCQHNNKQQIQNEDLNQTNVEVLTTPTLATLVTYKTCIHYTHYHLLHLYQEVHLEEGMGSGQHQHLQVYLKEQMVLMPKIVRPPY
jgi:hypothetical protein